MFPFWPTIVEPLMRIYRPKVMVEVGSEAGHHLAHLLNFAVANDAIVHSIDPKPLFDAEDKRTKDRLVMHHDISLNILGKLDAWDVVFIDGDHNWYTVFKELKLIEKRSGDLGCPFPLVLLHDVGWPWGRRDMYYDPSTIPAEFRQKYVRPKGPNAAKAGYHGDFCQAETDGGSRNGVLTAVEDFMAESSVPLELYIIPGFAGLGILVSAAIKETNPQAAKFIECFEISDAMRKYLEDLEASRMRRKLPGK